MREKTRTTMEKGRFMTTQSRSLYVAGSMLIAFLAFGASALAQQQQGITSGPAVGTPVVPSTTAQKQNPANAASGGQSNGTGVQPGAVGVGAPGAVAKSGSEGGPSPGPGSGKRP
jgi:hypothetical protein